MFSLFTKIRTRLGKNPQADTASNQGNLPQEADGVASANLNSAAAAPKTPGRLVVMGNESVFSKDLVDYAVDMADRMSYEIVAVNAAPLSCDTFKLFSSSRQQVCQDFQSLSEKNAEIFKKEVDQHHIPFTHVVKFCEADQALTELQEEMGEIDFIVSDGPPDQSTDEVVSEGEHLQSEIFVYSMI